jgi:hypothetical protein
MSYYSEWLEKLNDATDAARSQAFIEHYYALETAAYSTLLAEGQAQVSGQAAEMAERLGFGKDMVVYLGFLDGISPCLKQAIDLDSIADDTLVDLDIDFPVLFTRMHEVKADWLYSLKEWNTVLSAEEQQELTRAYRTSKIVRHEKIGRNDPCPCGSGKKYKNCHGRGDLA